MKKILLCAAFIAVSFTSIAQVGINTTTPDDSAVLDISSTSKGLLIPRMTTVERDAIVEPVEGLMVYVIRGVGVAGSFMYFDGDNWRELFRADLTIPEIISAGEGKDDLYENSGEQQVVYTILVNTDITGEITYFLKGRGDTRTELLRLDEINKNEVILIADPDYEEQEIYNFEVRAVSAAGKSSLWKPVTFSILPINEPASFSSDPSFTADENQLAIGRVTATDPEDATLSYSISNTETGSELEIEELTGVITFAVEPDYENVLAIKSYKATVTVSDETNNTTQEITVTLGDVNDLPTIEGTPSFTVIENKEYIFNALGADDDANTTLTYSIDNRPGWADFFTNTGALIGTPPKRTANGDDSKTVYNDIKIGVSDGVGPEVYLPVFKITVVDTSDPVITILGPNPMSIHKGSEYTEYDAKADTGEAISINKDDLDIHWADSYDIKYTAMDAAFNTTTETRTVVVEEEPVPVIGYSKDSNGNFRMWMDRNLGAKVRTENQNVNRENSWGYLYQWGRDSDGHESREHHVTTPGPVNSGDEGNNFVTNLGGGVSWLTSDQPYRWNILNDYKPSKGEHDPCPINYRLPSADEVEAEVKGMIDNNDRWNGRLTFPFAGWRTRAGDRLMPNTNGRYWTGTMQDNVARAFQITRVQNSAGQFENVVELITGFLGEGYSVRCIQQLPGENQEHED